MKRKFTAMALLCAFVMLLPISVSAQVIITKEPTAGSAIYIAGNPDMYPVEYYDRDARSYRGILPELYDEISENTGIAFAYIHAGNLNNQQRLAKNKQAEIISAHIKGQVDAVADEYTLLKFEKDGKTIEVCIGFTEIASAQTVSLIKEQLDKVTDGRLLGLSVSTTTPKQASQYTLVLYAVILLLVCVIVVLLVIVIRGRIKSRKRRQTQLTDSLTGIGNDKYFKHCFEHYISAASYSLYYVAYIAIEVQRIENYLGTTRAEEIQRYAANVLSSGIADTDFTARMTDGVFALGLECPSEELASQRIEGLLDKLNGYQDKFLAEYSLSFRAGVFHLGSANIPCETALFNARQGYNYAEENKVPYVISDDGILSRKALKARLQRKLSDALKSNQFKLYLQFIVDAKTGKICAAEALSRWQNPAEGLLTPSHYIDSMKAAGFIDRLDFYIFEESCRLLEQWNNSDKSELWLSCNFTRLTVSNADFLQRFEEIISRYSFDRKKMVIELTEDSLADNNALAFRNVLACKKAGFKIALDDLGSGYSSFSDLCDYPLDIIKIDSHIVAKSVTARGNALLRGITKLAHNLGIKVLCEGVETEIEDVNSKSAECDYIQGYYYSRVFPQEEASAFYSKYRI